MRKHCESQRDTVKIVTPMPLFPRVDQADAPSHSHPPFDSSSPERRLISYDKF